jgi:hypothetical protein
LGWKDCKEKQAGSLSYAWGGKIVKRNKLEACLTFGGKNSEEQQAGSLSYSWSGKFVLTESQVSVFQSGIEAGGN